MSTSTPPQKRPWRWIILVVTVGVVVAALAGAILFRRYQVRHSYARRGELYLKANNTAQAIRYFRLAIQENAKDVDAREGLVKALTTRKEFDGALKELETAAAIGLDEERVTTLRADVHAYWAMYRLGTAGDALTTGLCDELLAKNVQPSISSLEQLVPKSKHPAQTWARLGDLRSQRSQVLQAKGKLIIRDRDLARSLQKSDDAAVKEQEARALLPTVRESDRAARDAYDRAIEKDPALVHPRVAIAMYDMTGYRPDPGHARKMLEPLLANHLAGPEQTQVRQALAMIERYAGDYNKAIEHIRAMIDLDKDNVELQVFLADVLIEAQKWDEAATLSEKLAKLRPKDRAVAFVRGRVQLHEDRAADAANFLQNIFSDEKTRWPQARFELAKALLAQGAHEQAVVAFRRVLDDIAATSVTNVRTEQEMRTLEYQTHMALAAEREQIGLQEAVDHINRAFGFFPGNRDTLKAAKKLYRASGMPVEKIENLSLLHIVALAATPNKMDEAIETCRNEQEEYLDTVAKGARLQLMRARLLVRKGSYADAVSAYEGLRQLFPTVPDYGHELAALYARLGRPADARKLYESMLAANPKDIRAVAQMLIILVKAGETAAAQTLMERAERDIGTEQVRALMMSFYVTEKRFDDAVALARVQVQASPTSPAAHVLLAESLWRQGNLKEARSAYNTALRLAPDYPPAARRAVLDLQEGKADEAVALLTSARDRAPRNTNIVSELAVALQMAGKTPEATEALKDMLAPSNQQRSLEMPRWLLAILYAGEGNVREAISLNTATGAPEMGMVEDRQDLLQRIAALPLPARRDAALRVNLMMLFEAGNVPDAAQQQAELAAKLLSDDPLVATWRARMLCVQGKADEGLKLYHKIIHDYPRFIMPRMLVAEDQARSGKSQEVIQTLEETLDMAPPERAPWVQLRLGKAYEEVGQYERAIASYQAAAVNRTFAAVAYNNLAWLHATLRNDPKTALPSAEQAAKLAPNDPAILDTLGWVQYLNGDNDRALRNLENARQAMPSVPTVRYHYGMALLKGGRANEAKAELNEALTLSPEFAERGDTLRALEGK